jgi:translation elongation factor P/translation initiation factor 5A
MANEIVRRKKAKPGKGRAIAKTEAGAAPKRVVKLPTHAAKKQAKKAAKVVRREMAYAADHGQMTAFHHMQRASMVMSLMEKGTGKDLRALLERGVKLYRKAMEEEAKEKTVLRAIGVLRAVEHLSMAGLYSARRKYRQKVTSPTPEWLAKVIAETDHRLEQIERQERGKGTNLFPVTVELLRQAEDADIDAHLAFELAMAADALCFALENGL